MYRKRALGRINNGFVLVTVDERKEKVSFKTQGQDVTVRDLIENDHIYALLIKPCYGITDTKMNKKIWLDSYVTKHRPITPAIVSALIEEYYDQKVVEERYTINN